MAEVNMAVSQMDKVTQANAAETLHAEVGTLKTIVNDLELVVQGHRSAANDSDSHEGFKSPVPGFRATIGF